MTSIHFSAATSRARSDEELRAIAQSFVERSRSPLKNGRIDDCLLRQLYDESWPNAPRDSFDAFVLGNDSPSPIRPALINIDTFLNEEGYSFTIDRLVFLLFELRESADAQRLVELIRQEQNTE